MGKRPTPSHLQVVSGTYRPHRRLKREPKPAKVRPRQPQHLSDGAKRVWGELAPRLEAMGVLTEADGMALEMVCELIAEARRLRASLRDAELVNTYYVGKAARQGVRAEISALASHDARIRQWLAEFGLTPAARTKVAGDGKAAEEPADDFFG